MLVMEACKLLDVRGMERAVLEESLAVCFRGIIEKCMLRGIAVGMYSPVETRRIIAHDVRSYPEAVIPAREWPLTKKRAEETAEERHGRVTSI